MPMHYAGNRAQPYDHARGTGLVGKVMGPDADGEYLHCTDATYDPETDTTTAEFAMLIHPERAMAKMQDES